jgi:hypothetical protein
MIQLQKLLPPRSDKYYNEEFTIQLPSQKKITDIKWFSGIVTAQGRNKRETETTSAGRFKNPYFSTTFCLHSHLCAQI